MEAQENKLGIIKSFKYFTKRDLTHEAQAPMRNCLGVIKTDN